VTSHPAPGTGRVAGEDALGAPLFDPTPAIGASFGVLADPLGPPSGAAPARWLAMGGVVELALARLRCVAYAN
jgi:hypothetical protein